MERITERNTDEWLFRDKTGGLSGPGSYDIRVLPSKESFNFGHVPFLSSSYERSQLKGSALQASNLDVPGPGSYNHETDMVIIEEPPIRSKP
jgi:hypothetical protein